MLSENIKVVRKSKGLSQEELAIKLHVVRQTVSKWENGLSVPDSDMLLTIAEVLETPVSTLLGETVAEPEAGELKAIAEKLEVINLQLAQRKNARRKLILWLLIALCAVVVVISAVLLALNSPYLGWDYSDPETAVVGGLSGWRRLSSSARSLELFWCGKKCKRGPAFDRHCRIKNGECIRCHKRRWRRTAQQRKYSCDPFWLRTHRHTAKSRETARTADSRPFLCCGRHARRTAICVGLMEFANFSGRP